MQLERVWTCATSSACDRPLCYSLSWLTSVAEKQIARNWIRACPDFLHSYLFFVLPACPISFGISEAWVWRWESLSSSSPLSPLPQPLFPPCPPLFVLLSSPRAVVISWTPGAGECCGLHSKGAVQCRDCRSLGWALLLSTSCLATSPVWLSDALEPNRLHDLMPLQLRWQVSQ